MDNNCDLFPPWYKKSWGKTLIVILAFVFVIALSFFSYVGYLSGKIKKGEPVSFSFTKAQNAQTSKPATDLDLEKIETADDPFLGNRNAKLVLVEFADFLCGSSRKEFSVIRELASLYPNDLKIIYRDFPILGDDSIYLAMGGDCANEQGKFWQYYDYAFMNQGQVNQSNLDQLAVMLGLNKDKFSACLNSEKYKEEVSKDFFDGIEAGVSGTPTFFLNGYKIEGAVPLENFKKLLDKVLAAAK